MALQCSDSDSDYTSLYNDEEDSGRRLNFRNILSGEHNMESNAGGKGITTIKQQATSGVPWKLHLLPVQSALRFTPPRNEKFPDLATVLLAILAVWTQSATLFVGDARSGSQGRKSMSHRKERSSLLSLWALHVLSSGTTIWSTRITITWMRIRQSAWDTNSTVVFERDVTFICISIPHMLYNMAYAKACGWQAHWQGHFDWASTGASRTLAWLANLASAWIA